MTCLLATSLLAMYPICVEWLSAEFISGHFIVLSQSLIVWSIAKLAAESTLILLCAM